MKKQPSQKELVLRHLVRYGSITDAVAREKYGIARLAARIHELRFDGPNIYGIPVEFRTRLGRIGRYERYCLTTEQRALWRETIKGAK